MLNTCKVRRNTRTREIDQVVIDRPFTDERANVIYNYYRSVGIPIHLGKEAMRKELKKRGFNVDLEVAALHGSPHRYNKEILVRHEDGTIEYLVGTPEQFPTVPEGATILREFPNGRFRLDKIGIGEGAQRFGWGLYFTELEDIARHYANKLATPSETLRRLKAILWDKKEIVDLITIEQSSIKGLLEFKKAIFGTTEVEIKGNSFLTIEERKYLEKESNNEKLSTEDRSQLQKYLYIDNIIADFYNALDSTRNLYRVTLHKGKDPSEYTWLEWDKPVPTRVIKLVKEKLTEEQKEKGFYTIVESLGIRQETIYARNGEDLYNQLTLALGSAKAASLFLLENGIDGVKYPEGTISRGTTSETARGFNYVVFDENAITIEEHIQFLSTPSGEVYGFVTPEGEMFLDPDIAGVNTLIHEGAHIQYKVLKTAAERGDVKAQAILNKIQELTAPAVETIFNAKKAQERSSDSMTSADMQTYEEVIRNIPNLTEEQVKATAELLQTITENAAQRAGVTVEEYLKNRRSIYTEKPLSNARAVQLMNVEFSNHSNEQYNVLNQPNQNLKSLAKHPQIVKLGLDININEEAWIARYVTKTEEGKRLLGSLGRNPTAEQLRTALEEQFKIYGDKIKGGNEFYITEISDEYIDAQIEKARAESNSENIYMWEDVKRDKQRYIDEQQTLQRQNLSSLYDYYNNAIEYPLAMKLMILDAITKHDYRYNKDKDKIGRSKRGNNTISPHILPNSLFMNKVIEHPLSDKNIIHDYFYEAINFKGEKINLQDYKENVHKVEDNGTWYHFTQNRPQDEELFYKMSALSAEYPGAWCTGGSIGTAIRYLENGDLYIFYDNRINNPSIQLHVDDSTAIEIGGLEAGQGIRPEDVEIIDKFKKDNPEINLSDIEDYNRYSRLLLRWQKSDKDVKALSREDLKFLIQAKPYYKDSTGNLEKFKESLTKKEYAYLYNTTEDNVFDTLTNDNISELRENSVILGTVFFEGLELPEGFSIPKGTTFNGHVSFSEAVLPQNFTIQEEVTFNEYVDFSKATLPEGFTIPKGVTFNNYVFFDEITLPEGFSIQEEVTFNGQVSFYKAVLPQNFTIPKGTTFNGYVNFEMARLTEGFTIQEGVTFNGNVDFERATLLEGFTIQEGVTFNEDVTFSKAKLPQGFTIPKGVTFNESVSFSGATLPEGFSIQEGTTFNGYVNFFRTDLPQGFTIPKGVTFNRNVTFSGATLPQNFTIQEGVTFNGNVNFALATIPQGFTIQEGITFNGNVTFFRTALPQGFTIPEEVTFNGQVDFSEATLLEGFSIPKGTTFNGDVNFSGATLPQGFTIPEGVTFNESVNLSGTTLPQGFTIPEGVTFNGFVNLFGATLPEGFSIQEGVTFNGNVNFGWTQKPEGLDISEDYNSFTITYPDGSSVTHRKNQKAGEVLQQDNRGVIVQRGETSLTIFNRNSDITTIIHEKAHEYEHTLTPEEVKVLEEWSGHKQGTVEFSEAFAKGAEKVLYDGTFANEQVENIFTKFARWFQEVIQQAIKYFSDINEMNPEVISIYRNMMTRSGVVEETQVQEATPSEEAALPGELLNIINSPAYNQRENETDEQYRERLVEEVYATALGSNGEQYLKDLGFTAQEAKTFLQKVQEFLAEIVDWLRGKKGLQDLSVDEINRLSIREFLDRSTTSMMLGEFKDPSQTSALTPNREVQVYITPATVRNFNEETLRLKELTNEYNNVAKEISQGNLENQERFTILQNEILDTYQEHIQDKVSKIRGVNVSFNQPYLGSWKGGYEPSLNMTLSISPNADTGAISGLLFDIAENTSQDAFILEERSEIVGRTPLTEFDEAGMTHFPQIKVIFDRQLTVAEKSIVAQRLKSEGIIDFSIDGDYFIVSIIDFNSETNGQKKKFYAKTHAAITTLFRGDGERVGTNRVKDIQKHIKKSKYVAARNAEDEQSQTREYDRSDLFEAQSPNINPQISREQQSFFEDSDFDQNGNVRPEVIQEIEQEKAEIIRKAKEDGTWLKAPNGRDTNLNEDQWVTVRTKRFKNWFGDWINDPENASKVVDENGEPMVVYHGSTYVPAVGEYVIDREDILNRLMQLSIERMEDTNYREVVGYRIEENGNHFVTIRNTYEDGTSSEDDIRVDRYEGSIDNVEPHIFKVNLLGKLYSLKDESDIITVSDSKTQSEYKEDNIEFLNQLIEEGLIVEVGREEHEHYISINYRPPIKENNEGFSFSKDMIGSSTHGEIGEDGFFFSTDINEANRYGVKGGMLISSFLNIRNPEKEKYKEHLSSSATSFSLSLEELREFFEKTGSQRHRLMIYAKERGAVIYDKGAMVNTIEYAKNNGFDGVFIEDIIEEEIYSPTTQIVVFNPNQIKSATDNVGTFSSESNNINFQISGEIGASDNRSSQTQGFFSDVVTGASDRFKPNKPYQVEVQYTPKQQAFEEVYSKHRGNFDEHIATSIPRFRETQVQKGTAISAVISKIPDAKVLDIGGSEGSFVKSITEVSGAQSINLDPNPDMAESHRSTPVTGSEVVQEAFYEGFGGVQAYRPTDKFDVVHESMVFQFITSDRVNFVKEVVDNYLKEGGLFITEEKLNTGEQAYIENEIQKDTQHKSKYYDESQLKTKAEEILGGMNENQASAYEYLSLLRENFDYVGIYWNSGNFYGIVATNSKEKFNHFMQEVGDTTSEYTKHPIGEVTDEVIERIRQEEVEATAKALDEVDTQPLRKQLGIEANWDMIGEGDVLSGKDPVLAYTQRQLPDWNRESQKGNINPNSKITYDIHRTPATSPKTLPSGYVIEGRPEVVNKEIAYAKDENGVIIGMAEIETLNDGRNGIKHIAVAPEFRGKGVADKLIQVLKENNPQLDLSKTKLRSKGFEKSFGNKIIAEAYHKAKADGSNPELVKTVEELLGKSDTQGVQVLEYQGSTLSYKQRVNPITNQPTNQIEIDLISVPQENRRQGHARELLRRMTEIADSRGQELYLFAAPRDRTTTTEGLIKLYKEFGFESISSFLPEEMVRPARRDSQRAEESLPPAETLLTVDLDGVQEYVPADKIITYYSEMGEINYKENSEGELVMLKTISATPQQEESITYKQLLSIPNLSKEQALEAYKNLYSTDYYDWKNKTNEC